MEQRVKRSGMLAYAGFRGAVRVLRFKLALCTPAFCLILAACAETDLTPVINGLASSASAAVLSSGASSENGDIITESDVSSVRPESSQSASSAGKSSSVRSGANVSGAVISPSSNPASSPLVSSAGKTEGTVNIRDAALRKVLNTQYFGRTDDTLRQPSYAQMQTVRDLLVPPGSGVTSLAGIECAGNLRIVDVRKNPLADLSDVDWSSMPNLRGLLMYETGLTHLRGIDGAPWIENISATGDLDAGIRASLADLSGVRWEVFTNLISLDISCNLITDLTPVRVVFPSLQFMGIANNNISQAAALEFRQWFYEMHPYAWINEYQP